MMKVIRPEDKQQWPADFAYSVAKKVNAFVRRDLENSVVLKKHSQSAACFDRDEIRLGNLLGTGGFADAYELEEIFCRRPGHSRENKSNRSHMAEETQKKAKGHAPYVVKCLKPKFSSESHEKCIDAGYGLVMEAQFLSALEHPHILSIRGWASQGCTAFCHGYDGFFLILDRLKTTLDQRIPEWSKQMAQYKTAVVERMGRAGVPGLLFSGRLKVARDVASALAYLHANGIMYRDLKPSNVGFDMEGNVKIFDFGLARELPQDRELDEMFQMTALVGTPRYMSPEVGFAEAYNEKSDVYSLSLVLWEMMALEKPFLEMSVRVHRKVVLGGGLRPEMDAAWPEGIKSLMQSSWDVDPRKRPTMRSVHRLLDNEVQKMRRSTVTSKKVSHQRQTPVRSLSMMEKLRHH